MSFKLNFKNIYIIILLLISFFVYWCFFFIKFLFLNNVQFYTTFFFSYDINYIGLSLFITGIFIGLFVYWLSDIRIFFYKLLSIFVFIFFIIIIYFFITEKSYINLFIIYELFLLPSFFLVYYLSPNRRSIPTAIYFLTWTQFGSLFVLVGIIYIYINIKSIYLHFIPQIKLNILFLLFFCGFGIKIPLWPFYYWLTKTHVEASSFFSIYLSGFLVKTAIFLFYYLYSFFFNFFYINFLFIIILIGIIDSSFKMWSQIDLKKLIAYTTVQEMNILCIPIFFNTENSEFIISFFIITHCLLSSLFFFIIDVLIKRYNSRSTNKISGIIHLTPNFGISLFISIIFFSGLPFTIKFTNEILIFNSLFLYNIDLFFIIFFSANWIGTIGFAKNFFNILYGQPISNLVIYDLTKKELYIFFFIWFNLFFFNYLTFIFF